MVKVKKLNVFILAAGLGERLRPLTDHIPKPLMPVLGKPALQHVLDTVSDLPFHKIGINLHHKKGAIEKWIAQFSWGDKITQFHESKMLGTGGALKNAEHFLRDSTFLVHNADILSDINLDKLFQYHISSENLGTLAVHDYPRFNTLLIDEKGLLKEVGNRGKPSVSPHSKGGIKGGAFSGQRLAFTGIAVYGTEFLNFLPQGTSSVVGAWMEAVRAGYNIGTMDVSGCQWSDIGTPPAYASAVFEALRNEGETIYIHSSIKNCQDIDLHGNVVIENESILGNGITLRNCIVLPGSDLKKINPPSPPSKTGGAIEGEVLVCENCIIGPGMKVDLNESETGLYENDGRYLIGTGGSDRKYYRIRKENKSSVLMQCNNDDPDFERHIELSRYFMKRAIPVPALIAVRPESMKAEFEDAGDLSLYSYLKCPREEVEIESLYKKVINAMIQIHMTAAEHISECPPLQERAFDYTHFRWETDYFMERFIMGVKQLRIEHLPALEKEFHNLALRADSFLKTVIHRDFQAQNIMIMKGQKIRIIDFQGARIGPPAYDVASILWDPYYRLDEYMRQHLLDYYLNQMQLIPPSPSSTGRLRPLKTGGFIKKGGTMGGSPEAGEINIDYKFDEKEIRDSLLPCRLQRHMQALGAYGFLSSIKGKKYFLKFVPEAVRLLKEDIILAKDHYPELYKLVSCL